MASDGDIMPTSQWGNDAGLRAVELQSAEKPGWERGHDDCIEDESEMGYGLKSKRETIIDGEGRGGVSQ